MGCPKRPMWESDGEAGSEDEDVSSGGSREGNVWLYGPGDQLSFPAGWELAKVALCSHMVLDMLCQEMHEAWLVVAAR